jgi:toxin HigB-1
VIVSFRHKGLQRFFSDDDMRGISVDWAKRLRMLLTVLNNASEPQAMNISGFALHPLKGERQGTWAVRVTGNWWLTFRFEGIDACDVNLEDYH